jgi:hypothetical protein
VDVVRITFLVRGSTVLLGGCIANSEDRLEIIECAMEEGIMRVIDSMTLPGEESQVNVYLGPGSQHLRNAIADTYDTRTTWEARRALSAGDRSADVGRLASPARIETLRACLRRATRWLVAPFG